MADRPLRSRRAPHTTTISPRSVTATWTSRTARWPEAAGSGDPRLPSARTRAAHTPPESSATATAAPLAGADAVATAPVTCRFAPTIAGAVKPVGAAAWATDDVASSVPARARAVRTRSMSISNAPRAAMVARCVSRPRAQLEPVVRRGEPETAVEPVRLGAARVGHHHEQLGTRSSRGHRGERARVGRAVAPVAGRADLVGGDERDDRGDIVAPGAPHRVVGAAGREPREGAPALRRAAGAPAVRSRRAAGRADARRRADEGLDGSVDVVRRRLPVADRQTEARTPAPRRAARSARGPG